MPIGKARLKISDYRDERKRTAQIRERKIQVISLSLTSMVDMFAILVIFLLTNTETVAQWIEVGRGIELPKAKHVESPSQGTTIQLSKTELYFDREKIKSEEIPLKLAALGKDTRLNIVAHEAVDFGSVRKILGQCQSSGFQNINLAVQPLD